MPNKLLSLFSLIIPSLFNAAVADNELRVGETAPEFRLLDQNNKTWQLADFRDQWLVVYFYPKDDTPGCTEEACRFRDDILAIHQLNAKVVGISIDNTESHKEFSQKHQLPFPLLADTKGEIAKRYGSLFSLGPIRFAKRHSFIISPQGKIAVIYRDVSPKQHSQEIIAQLQALQSN